MPGKADAPVWGVGEGGHSGKLGPSASIYPIVPDRKHPIVRLTTKKL